MVRAGKKAAVVSAATVLLDSSISRKKAAAPSSPVSTLDAQVSSEEIQSMEELLEAIKSGKAMNNEWNFEMMWIVARNAIMLRNNEAWMSIKHASS